MAPPYSHGQTVYFGAVRYRFVGYEDAGGTLQPADSDRCRVAEPASTVHLSGVLVVVGGLGARRSGACAAAAVTRSARS